MLISKTDTVLDLQAETKDGKIVHIVFQKVGMNLVEGRIAIPDLFIDIKSVLFKDELAPFAVENPKFNFYLVNRGSFPRLGMKDAVETQLYVYKDTHIIEFTATDTKVWIHLSKEDADELVAFLHLMAK